MSSTLLLLGIGFALGAVATWLLNRRSVELASGKARTDAQIEIARLNERLTWSTTQTSQLQSRGEDAERKHAVLQIEVEKLRDERARLGEQADRVVGLEFQIGQYGQEIKEQAARSASLGEQASRLPELERKLTLSTQENDGLKAQLADLREKLGEQNPPSQLKAQKSPRPKRVCGR